MKDIGKTLTVITTSYDDPTFFYIDNNLHAEVAADDKSYIPEILYGIINSQIITKVVELRLNNQARERLFDECRVVIGLEKLNDYKKGDFE